MGADVREADGLIVVGGLCASSAHRSLDAYAQVHGVVEALRSRLRAVDADLRDLVKLVIAHTLAGEAEPVLLDAVGAALGRGVQAVVTLVPLRNLAFPGQLVQVNAIAMRERARTAVTLPGLASAGDFGCHGLRCGPFAFTSGQSAASEREPVRFPADLVAQNRCMLDNLASVLDALAVPLDSVVKGNSWRTQTPPAADYERAAQDRFAFFEVSCAAVTGITVPGLGGDGHLTRLDLWALDADLPRLSHRPPDHWDWSMDVPYSHGLQAGPWLFVGGQAALDARCNVLAPGNVARQTSLTMDYVTRVVNEAGGSLADVLSMDAYLVGGEVIANRTRCLDALSTGAHVKGSNPSCGPVLSDVPVEALAYPAQVFELEALAHLPGGSERTPRP